MVSFTPGWFPAPQSQRASPTRVQGHPGGQGTPAGASTFCPLDIGILIGYNICVEMGSLPMPARPADGSARSHKVFVMLLPDCQSFPPLQGDSIPIRGEDCSIKQSPQPSEKEAKSHPLFPAQGPSLSRCVTKIRELVVGSRHHDKPM